MNFEATTTQENRKRATLTAISGRTTRCQGNGRIARNIGEMCSCSRFTGVTPLPTVRATDCVHPNGIGEFHQYPARMQLGRGKGKFK